jgi:hypothetical protein
MRLNSAFCILIFQATGNWKRRRSDKHNDRLEQGNYISKLARKLGDECWNSESQTGAVIYPELLVT